MSGAGSDWAYLRGSGELCQVIGRTQVWGEKVSQVYIPLRNEVRRVREELLAPATDEGRGPSLHELVYRAAAAKIADALEQDVLVAPLRGSLVPLPHQIYALSRAMSGNTVRYLLADEVGLGKTIEAGLILKELKVRGLIRRTLVVAPAGLLDQWVQEMRTHFEEDFRVIRPSDFRAVRQVSGLSGRDNVWQLHDQIVCSVDSVKPVESRQGWSREQTARYNRERFEDLIAAGWDLVIVDEAHRLGGSSEQVARYQLGEALAQSTPYLLLLSATPHQGKTDAFRRLLSHLDPDAFPDDESVKRDRVERYVIRTEKRRAIDAEGKPLFMPREVRLLAVAWGEGRAEQRALYEAVTEYVRDGYNQALREKQTAVGFLMILMQRLVTSSTRAIREALERRLEVLELPEGQLPLFGEDIALDWAGLEGDEQLESVLKARLKGLRNERSEVELLISTGRRCEASGPDAKASALLDLIRRLELEENDPDVKVLVFTEFVATQDMLLEFLNERGIPACGLNGSMPLDDRITAQKDFAREKRVLVSTEAGGEGLNLQFCHVVVNYDLPWNPMRVEQRIGRVDRIGQERVVRAFNFALDETVELRVREVLESKLATILDEFGVDKLGDVLDSEAAEIDFDQLYVGAVLRPEKADDQAERFAHRLREQVAAAREGLQVLGESPEFTPDEARQIGEHQLPYWTERMTVEYLRAQQAEGAEVKCDDGTFDLVWPDGTTYKDVAFTSDHALSEGLRHVSLEDPRVGALVAEPTLFAAGQPIPEAAVEGLPGHTAGVWSLWQISLEGGDRKALRVLPLFVSDDHRVLGPTARAIWDRTIEGRLQPTGQTIVDGDGSIYSRSRAAAEETGAILYSELERVHHERLERERAKLEDSFAARKRAIDRIGLEQVRLHRRAQLGSEYEAARKGLAARENSVPDLAAIQLIRITSPQSL